MLRKDFFVAVDHVKYHSKEDLENSLAVMEKFLVDIKEELKLISHDMRRIMYYFSVNVSSDEERIAELDKILIPDGNERFKDSYDKIFPQLQAYSLNQLNVLRLEKKRILRRIDTYNTRLKKEGERLADAFKAEESAIDKKWQLIYAIRLQAYFEKEQIEIKGIYEIEILEAVYEEYVRKELQHDV